MKMDNLFNNFKPKLLDFLNAMASDDYSYFKYSLSGDLYDKSKFWGLGNLVFASKILYISGLMSDVDTKKKNNLTESILNFSSRGGYIIDPLIASFSLKRNISILLGRTTKDVIKNNQRAETRQAFAALYLLNSKPKQHFEYMPYSEEKISEFLSSFDWSKPWSAGSHFSHLMFFLRTNDLFFEYKRDKSGKLIKYSKEWVDKLQSSEDGCWYKGKDVSLRQKINGAMKVITGFHAAKIFEFDYPKKLIDSALEAKNDIHACDNFNVVFVLYAASKIEPNYRKDDIEEFLTKRMEIYSKHYLPDYGGFSFFPNKSNSVYYGKKISKGLKEPDIHGTAMFVWGLSLIDEVLKLGLDFNIPLN